MYWSCRRITSTSSLGRNVNSRRRPNDVGEEVCTWQNDKLYYQDTLPMTDVFIHEGLHCLQLQLAGLKLLLVCNRLAIRFPCNKLHNLNDKLATPMREMKGDIFSAPHWHRLSDVKKLYLLFSG